MKPIPFVKPISVLGILQFVICVAGFMFTATVMKVMWGEIPEAAAVWRNKCLLLILIPAAWTIFASWDIEYDLLQVPYKFHFFSGIALCGILLFLWMGVAMASTPPSLIHSISIE